jgi:hypothetical protein
MSAVWERSQHSGTDLLMLLALADFSDDGGNSYPATSTLAKKCRMHQRNATYILRDLQASGELEVRTNEGPHGTNRYRIVLDALGVQRGAGGVQASAGVQPDSRLQHGAPTPCNTVQAPPAIQSTYPLQPVAPEPSGTVNEPSMNRQRGARTRATTTCPVDVADQVWEDWLALRASKRAKVTETVIDSARKEATKAGMSFEEFLTEWCLRGSQGLKADWLKPGKLAPGKSSAITDKNIAAAQRYAAGGTE